MIFPHPVTSPFVGERNDVGPRIKHRQKVGVIPSQARQDRAENIASISEITTHVRTSVRPPKGNREEVSRVGQVIHQTRQFQNDCRST